MSTSDVPGTSENQTKDSSGIVSDIDCLRSPHAQGNIETSIQPAVCETGSSGKCLTMDCEPTTVLQKSPPAYKSLPSNMENKSGVVKIDDIQNITTDLHKTKLSSDQSYPKPSSSNLLSPEKKKGIMRPTSVTLTKPCTGPSIVEPSGSKTPIQNPSVQPDAGPSVFKALVPNLHQFPPTKQKVSETFELLDACSFFISYLKSKRTDLKYQEHQLYICTTNIQKALRDAKQVCFKFEVEPETIDEEINCAITQSQKLACLLSISYRVFRKLHEMETKLQESLQTYTNEADIFHFSVDRLSEYIIDTIFEKCVQMGTL